MSDINPVQGDNFYRIRTIAPDSSVNYSNVVLVKLDRPVPGIRVYPNPVSGGTIGTEFKEMAAGVYNARLINSNGQTIFNKTITHTAGSSIEQIEHGYHLIPGIYQLEIKAPGQEGTTIKVIAK